MIDLAVINTRILYQLVTLSRRHFILKLVDQIIEDTATAANGPKVQMAQTILRRQW